MYMVPGPYPVHLVQDADQILPRGLPVKFGHAPIPDQGRKDAGQIVARHNDGHPAKNVPVASARAHTQGSKAGRTGPGAEKAERGYPSGVQSDDGYPVTSGAVSGPGVTSGRTGCGVACHDVEYPVSRDCVRLSNRLAQTRVRAKKAGEWTFPIEGGRVPCELRHRVRAGGRRMHVKYCL